MSATVTKGFEPQAKPQVIGTAVSYGFPLRCSFRETWDYEQLSSQEKQLLVRKLDTLRHEPTISFTSTEEAVAYLRSRVKRSR